MRVLVVEDEWKVSNALREGLEAEQYEVTVERTGEGAFFRSSTESFDIILLDLGLPGRDGLEILTVIRRNGIKVPVIALTARDSVADRVAGLDGGADDYVVKPFAFAELLARMRVLMRRGAPVPVRLLAVGDLTLDNATRKVSRAGRSLELTVKEFELLEYLMRHEGEVVSRETISREVWREPSRSITIDNIIDVHMTRLRRKIEIDGAPALIHTIRGVGFTVREGGA